MEPNLHSLYIIAMWIPFASKFCDLSFDKVVLKNLGWLFCWLTVAIDLSRGIPISAEALFLYR